MKVPKLGIEKKFFDSCSEVVVSQGYELYDLEYIAPQKILRVYIMNPETKTAVIEDCVTVDKALTPCFEEDWVPDDVVLEVSSPGVFRKLKNKQHFEESIGKRVALKYRGDLELDSNLVKEKALKNKNLTGTILKVNSENEENFSLDFEVPLKKENVVIKINSEQLVKANWEPEL